MISDGYKSQLQQMHAERNDFGARGHAWLPAILDLWEPGETLLDYGCGQGKLCEALREKYPGTHALYEYDPGIPGKDERPEPADLVVCTDVAEHVEPEHIDAFLDELQRLSKSKLFLNVATRPAKKELPDGRNAHLTIEPFAWWQEKLAKRFVIQKAHVDPGQFTALLKPRQRPLRVFIGYDARQPAAFTVASLSLIQNASGPIHITPLVIETLPITRTGLTPFTFSRFLAPWLCDYEGVSLFVDADVMFRGDVFDMLKHYKGDAITVVDHPERKFERSSVMLFNNEKCKVLTPDFVQNHKGILSLEWAESIGTLPNGWNHLVGYDQPNQHAKIVHFTQGLPCYQQTIDDEHGLEWRNVAQHAISALPWDALMGPSVHAQHVRARAA